MEYVNKFPFPLSFGSIGYKFCDYTDSFETLALWNLVSGDRRLHCVITINDWFGFQLVIRGKNMRPEY